MKSPRIFIAFHGRFPSEKAAALFVAENAQSFSGENEVSILVPRRLGTVGSAYSEYGLQKNISIIRFPIIDLFWLFRGSRIPFYISLALFSVQIGFYSLWKGGRNSILICNDLAVALFASYSPMGVVYEVHDYPERGKSLVRWILSRIDVIIATNIWKRDALTREYPESASKIVLERNGVDVHEFANIPSRLEARKTLGLPEDASIALYTGHLYTWKGVRTFAEAAKLLPHIRCICVGGTSSDVAQYRSQYSEVPNLSFIGHVPHAEIPLWQAAADLLVLPNTAKEEISQHYTSPMKLFEYMASGRPVVASRIPSITELIDDTSSYLFEADNSDSLADAITMALNQPRVSEEKGKRAQQHVAEHSWDKRAERLRTVFVGYMKRS